MGERSGREPGAGLIGMAGGPQELPQPPRATSGFLGAAEREFTRRDFLVRSSVAGLVVAAGGIFLAPAEAEASVPPGGE
ncbi:MAG: twin-arginine translocation signal domain-containing protein, partial [Anaeromyxobacteraceae bacterium]|nr:twin-arginine translocation signal domain-containing protein [Anaeromyxobacteraceae bacterium]